VGGGAWGARNYFVSSYVLKTLEASIIYLHWKYLSKQNLYLFSLEACIL
jgi:hypothetical protein